MTAAYEREQDEQKAVIEATRRELKEQERSRTNVKSFIAATKKYTDLHELDATVLREFIDRIYVSAVDKSTKTREIKSSTISSARLIFGQLRNKPSKRKSA